jgi:hypothetical protein
MTKFILISVVLLIAFSGCKTHSGKNASDQAADSNRKTANDTDKKMQMDSPMIAMDSARAPYPKQPMEVRNSLYVLDCTPLDSSLKDTSLAIRQALAVMDKMVMDSASFIKHSYDVYEETTEGCEIIVAKDSVNDRIQFYGTQYGETGQLAFHFYAIHCKLPRLIGAVFTEITYNKYMDEDGKIRRRKKTYDIFHDAQLIAVLDATRKKTVLKADALTKEEDEARTYFTAYIGQIEKGKQ